MQPPTGSFVLTGLIAASAWVALTLLSVASGYLLERAFRSRRVWALPLAAGQLRRELIGNAIFLAVAILTTALVLEGGVIRFAPPADATVGRGLGTFLVMLLGFQAYYYAAHRLMHHRALVRFHRWHHESRVTTPWSGQSMSWVEALVWMGGYFGVPALLSLLAPLSFGGWVAYLAFNVFGNLVGHANVELVAPRPGLWWQSTLATVFTFHALHHARWTGHFGFASTWADRLFRTEWSDWPDLHGKVWRGEALTSLKQRGQPR
ncbi:MAG: sterol desaturase family protein [Myxococcaceae bacterium]|nr:sterol desaturase family protein [Myxococcaceae bacterium]